MKKISGERITLAVGVTILGIATWFAASPSAPSTTGLATTATAASSSPSSSPTARVSPPGAVKTNSAPAALINIAITSPASNAQWVIGAENTISWNKPGGVPGQMWLVDDTTGAVVGWILQTVGPSQLYYPWNTRDVFLSETNPSAKDVLPGKYIIKMSFTSPSVPGVTSQPFSIIAAPVQQPK